MRQSLKKSSPVVEPLIPIFGSIRPTSKPGVSASTTNAEMPRGPRRDRSSRTRRRARDTGARDEALRRRSGRTRRPRAARSCASLRCRSPSPASVSAYAASHSPLASLGRKRCFCSSVPASLIPSDPSSCTAMISAARRADLRDLLDATSAISALAPMPPYSSSNRSPKRPFSRKSSTMSHGNSADLSISAARGATRSRASARTSSRISRCSSFSGSRAPSAGILRRAQLVTRFRSGCARADSRSWSSRFGSSHSC